MSKELTESVKESGMISGADLVGVADAETLRSTARDCDAGLFLKGARTVVLALAADPPGIENAEDIKDYVDMALEGYARADRAQAAMQKLLRRQGYRTRFVVREWHRAPGRNGRVFNTLSLKHAATAAGLGSMGRNRLIITPQFGCRARLSGFITDAPLEAGAPFTQRLCDDCGKCVRACPSGAITADGPFDFPACAVYLFAGISRKELESLILKPELDILARNAGRLINSIKGWTDSISRGKRLYYNCGACVRVCDAHKRFYSNSESKPPGST